MPALKHLRFSLGVIGLLISQIAVTSGQTPTEISQDEILLSNGSTIFTWNVTQARSAAITNASISFQDTINLLPSVTVQPAAFSIAVDQSRQFLYTIEAITFDDRGRPTATQFVQTLTQTGERRILLDRPGLYNFQLSPDGGKIFLTYFDGVFSEGALYGCILDLASSTCDEIELQIALNPYSWLDNNKILFLSSKRNIHQFDVATQSLVEIPISSDWYIRSFTPIPNRNSILIAADTRDYTLLPVQFLEMNLDTLVLSDLSYDALDNKYTSVQAWSFSPDGRYLFYGNLIHSMVLVEFETGKVLGEFEDVTQTLWLNDCQLIFATGVESSPSIFEFDVQTGQTTTLIADAAGMVILN